MIFTEEFVAGIDKRDWLGFFGCLIVAVPLVVLLYHVTHRIPADHLVIIWGWRHYVGVGLTYALVVVLAAILLWLPLRRYLK